MTARPARDTLDSLRVTLQKLEQETDPASNGQDAVELKQIMLNRIAELEALQALLPEEVVSVSGPSDLPSIAVTTEEVAPKEEAADAPRLEKLD
jgi:hypothetical protein